MYYAVYRFGPRWASPEEAIGAEVRAGQGAPSIADAAGILADAEAIYVHDLDLDEIENLAEARNSGPAMAPEMRTEAASDLQTLARARLLVVTGGSGTAEDLEAVAREAAGLPDYVMAQFERKKIRIVACRDSVTDFETGLRGLIPRGWEETGRTWDDVPGTYLDGAKRVVIATIACGGGRAVPPRGSGTHGSVSLAVHESLHGYDYCGGHAVLSDQRFLAARERDMGALDAYQRQQGRAGLEETFAESGSRFVVEPDQLRQDCPNLFGYWQGQPAAIEAMTAVLETSSPLGEVTEDEDRPIGVIRQSEDGNIRLDLRAEGPGGAIGHVMFDLSTDDPAYGAVRRQLPAAAMEATGTAERLYRPLAGDPGRRLRRGRRPKPSRSKR
jgi:hypothetical protein